ncbi:MAG: homoserine O-acetyltransferase [Verrucomicrobia bacterium]|nr:homoserine O-acetyltransferase [Verrucomicrobiota bacterium]MBU4247315.1 homoserine O-acetyltransferase [Verrucomicrobiota bacterium]MBU4428877.1 homoserine O-acetyltransferase [Verrucomicrobiota bacterium]MBU4497562.1 homoserine O-acetyltransferase [Verrucomicrobiota bacterium]MCG2680026.1 homoserine O-acetyltransferase [Kiritimatiellia bacterium]
MTEQGSKSGNVGVVKTQIVKINLPPEGLVLANRETLPELQVAYEAYGPLAPTRDNVVYICHALTGDAHVAGVHDMPDAKPGWWDAMVGPGKGLNTQRFHVICANILGGCMGTTGPSSLNPRTGKPYGSSFPSITTGDIVRVQYLLLKQLGIRRLAAVVGGSFGGMQVLEWAIRYPEMVDKCVCIASAMSLSAQALAFDIVGRNAILADPAWAGGNYYEHLERPAQGLSQARMIGHITYLSSENMKRKFGREKNPTPEPLHRFATPFQVESYLDYQGNKFVNRFDANSYLHITEAMDVFDLTENVDDPAEVFRNVDLRTQFLVVALSSDWLFPPEQSLEVARTLVRAGKRVTYCLLKSPYGHDAFLVEVEHLAEVMRTFLEAPRQLENAISSGAADSRAAAPGQGEAGKFPRTRLAMRSGDDYRLIEDMVRPGSRVLDLGCGDGELICRLMTERRIIGLGMDIDLDNVIQVIRKGLDVFQCDLDAGLSSIPDQSYDYAILSQTLQVVRKPRFVLSEMLRVAREGIISFPNFGHWRHRLRLGFIGRMPVSDSLPFEWYDTPNIHLSTLKDFRALCRKDGIRIVDVICISGGWPDSALIRLGLRNAGSDRILIKIARIC